MQIRNNVRERRRERIEQLIGRHALERSDQEEQTVGEQAIPRNTSPSPSIAELPLNESNLSSETGNPPPFVGKQAFVRPGDTAESDPELWWKEREKRLKSGQAADWQGLKGISPSSSSHASPSRGNLVLTPFLRGLSLRIVLALLVLAGTWGWFKLELPGSAEARAWMVTSVTRDMDFDAVEAWYGNTFGGSPSFFSFNRNQPDTQEVSARLNPTETVVPIVGRVVQSYAQNGAGVRFAAAGGSEVYAIYTGRVQQVSPNQDGGVTIIVQHQNHILSVYGGLEHASVKPNDWVKTGQQVGRLKSSGDSQAEGVLYFAVQQQGKALNPAEVVSID
ncbi:M23 family metallopeptidase [Cohnella mopanensis]|uniref:M23 family metallopeptidase n=1 Tax=Cohnella mopanensis TaxID=2911966 RepID=UPI001EF75498|nr:M23 family metallopeptidase [Cohnella mopanensis]